MGHSTSNPTSGIGAAVRDELWLKRSLGHSDTFVTFRKATLEELMNAWREDDGGNRSPSLYLASQGLYDDTNTTCLFHPSIVSFAVGRVLQHSISQNDHNHESCITVKGDSYTVSKKFLDRIINMLSLDPKGLYQ